MSTQTKQPEFEEKQWRELYDMLEEATPIGAKFANEKEELSWYRRSAMIQSIKACFGWRSRAKKQEGVTGNGNPDPSPDPPDAE